MPLFYCFRCRASIFLLISCIFSIYSKMVTMVIRRAVIHISRVVSLKLAGRCNRATIASFCFSTPAGRESV
ncbi:hypothetical protein KIN20_019565 [Parelaphostrongylus tenuis]|uniref:Uncharacterized protein n=1 Tax=Parelaphostrongylus tenuis TaxID=148309 RepID=A0AAD5N4Z3_PARTN|nr:hypothetical protein KIN20_019565 [Parelaphostrongylus tenuis]